MDLSPATIDYINDKIQSLDKYVERFEEKGAINVEVEITRSSHHHKHGDVYTAHVNLVLNGDTLRVEKTGEDVHALIDEVKDTLKGEVLKYKERKTEN